MSSPQLFDYSGLFEGLTVDGVGPWASLLRQQTADALSLEEHGNLAEWVEAWHSLPVLPVESVDTATGCVTVRGHVQTSARQTLKQTLSRFRPWRKGPFELFGIRIDTEWRSDWKWERVQPHVDLRNRNILDVGCGNGYFGWRMLSAGARLVVGLDPFLLFVMQHEVLKYYLGAGRPNYVLPLSDAVLCGGVRAFDVTFSMGVLYHRISPIEHLQSLHGSLRPGGQLVLETLVWDTAQQDVLVPEQRYAKMRNVWFIPSPSMLTLWLRRCGFRDIQVVDMTPTSTNEQRRTEWMTFESLADFLDPADPSKTIEGYPAPVRAVVIART